MAFVERRAGAIVGVYANPQPGYAEEQVADKAPEVQAFRDAILAPPRDLAAEIDALKAKAARTDAIEAAAVKAGVLTQKQINDEVKPVEAIAAAEVAIP
jgi:hypothetical protein